MSINEKNYKKFLTDYLDNRLSVSLRNEVEQFILINTEAWAEMQSLKRIKLHPDTSIKFPLKHLLLQPEEEEEIAVNTPVRKLGWWSYTTIASIAAMLLLALLFRNDFTQPTMQGQPQNVAVDGNKESDKPQTIKPKHQPTIIVVDAGQNTQKKLVTIGIQKYKVSIKSEVTPTMINNANISNKKESHPIALEEERIETLNLVEPVSQSIAAISINNKGLNLPNDLKSIDIENNKSQEPENDGFNLLTGALHFFKRNVSLRKETIAGESYYALSVETPKIRINKTFRTEF